MKSFWTGWHVYGDSIFDEDEEDIASQKVPVPKWPAEIQASCTGGAMDGSHTTWIGRVEAEHPGDAMARVRACYPAGTHIEPRWMPREMTEKELADSKAREERFGIR